MNKIKIGIYDEHKLAREGLNILLQNNTDFEVTFMVGCRDELFKTLNMTPVNVLLVNVHGVNNSFINLMIQVKISFPKLKTLVISVHDEEEVVLKIVKAGANGFLARDSEREELTKAIYTLRNGHDYYSESITHLLLKRYISKIQNENSNGSATLKNLSTREIEIIELWGNSHTNKEIAEKLFISVRTVESHKNHIMQKLNLKTAVDLVKFAIKNNIIEIQ